MEISHSTEQILPPGAQHLPQADPNTARDNTKHRQVGHLLQGRYEAVGIEADEPEPAGRIDTCRAKTNRDVRRWKRILPKCTALFVVKAPAGLIEGFLEKLVGKP
jgi:hypothetical protein